MKNLGIGLVLGCIIFAVVAATTKPPSRLPSTAYTFNTEVDNDNLICGEKKWIVGTNWGPSGPVQLTPLDQSPVFVRVGNVFSNLQVTFIDGDRAHVMLIRTNRLPDVIKTFRFKSVEEELQPAK